MSQDAWIDDVFFILEECARLQGLLKTKEGRSKLKPLDFMLSLPMPAGRGPLLCGVAASRRLQSLSASAINLRDPGATCDPEDVEKALAKLITERFVVERREINVEQVQHALSDAVNIAKTACVDITHFVPCRLMHEEKDNEFSIGPISFRSLPKFAAALEPFIERYLDDAEARDARTMGEQAIARAKFYYEGFGWIATVKVPKCAPQMSAKRSLRAVTTAVNLLHTVFGAYHTRRMVVGGPRSDEDHRATLRLVEEDRLLLSWSTNSTSAVGFADDLQRLLARDDIAFLLSKANKIIEPVIDTSTTRPLALRFSDAAAWFGQAVRDEGEAASVVKAITAIERLVVTRERKDLTAMLSERAAALLYTQNREKSYDDQRKRIARMYDLRSRLVHGSLSPFDAEVRAKRWPCLELAEEVLCAALSVFDKNNGFDMVRDDKQLASGFDSIVSWARE